LGMANAWLFLVAAELIASSKGLGFLLIDSQNTGRTDVMLLAIIVLAGLGKLSDASLGALERRMAVPSAARTRGCARRRGRTTQS
jgi:sulfonate transport system permease protein